MEGWQIIQGCELAPLTGLYDRDQFIKAISHITPEDFNRFCRTFLHLSFFHANNQNVWATDNADLVAKNLDLFWKIKPIDVDAPVNFRRVE